MANITPMLEASRRASREIALRSPEETNSLLLMLADATEAAIPDILRANEKDLARMSPDNPKRDRLQLTESRIRDIASDMRSVASLPSPLGISLSKTTRPNGMTIEKVTVPFGVIGIIYEARPNVTFDVFSLCVKAGSACILKGGSDAQATNECTVALLQRLLTENGWNEYCVTLLPNNHETTTEMLHATGYVDLIIPRGSKKLIEYVRDNARVPVIETGAGVCHTYVHTSANLDIARDIVFNAKTRRVSVCNALDTLVIDAALLSQLPYICSPLSEKHVEIYADEASYSVLDGIYPYLHRATEDDFGREWLDYKMSVKAVDGLNEAIKFIDSHTSRHSECIVAEDKAAQQAFLKEIDAACVYVNVSTAFTDGGQFGFGAEIGISTQKLHARGPMALPEITTYKYIVTGNGQTRS
ncbi:glutamate-5-semialdehyde dehydrogenase [Barnesiella sp. WM24]|uniref:glutamate-5-semialdehyde dehydrogenase n=1 Tax=Barnesiella sp. WM24 TaxID=2558278 RepID=UPI00107229AC|nr:glutamate-5-semialdehyde dehydrogenase [Barnesiella sp. WM24]TFU92118.1 glutamate-5-semialdehyde dehydrogenase [Barnesiella sp. WM24]